MDAYRTPDERFAELPGFDVRAASTARSTACASRTSTRATGEPVVFVHGEPTWSYLWRKVIPPVLDAGHRCIAPDHAGFGRSDKPTELGWYSYDRHSELFVELLDRLDLRDATVVVHDWGGPIGLRAAVEHPDRIARMVIMDTGLFTGEQPMSDAWKTFRDFVERTEDLPIGFLVKGACARGHGRRGRSPPTRRRSRPPSRRPARAPSR